MTFVVHITVLEAPLFKMMIHLLRKAHLSALIQDEAPIKVPFKYVNYADVFSFTLAIESPENTGINEHAIELEEDKQPPYKPI